MPNTDIIAIRHGKTEYTEKGLDLTEEGITETKDLARVLGPDLEKYDEIIVISSPLARTRGTAKVFLDELGMSCEPRIIKGIRCVDVHDLLAFTNFGKENSTNIYGEMWFKHPKLAEDSDFAEGRNSVNSRAYSFLRHISGFIKRRSIEEGKSICIIAFTHFEIASNYLRPLYPDNVLPSEEAPGLKNSEAVTISVSTESPDDIVIKARGLEAKVCLQDDKLTFTSEL